jgi:hypothetical protein
MGRGSRTPTFLERLGYERPIEDEVVMRLAYSSQLLRIPPGMHKEIVVLVGPVPGRLTGMALFSYENSTWMLTVIGLMGHEPPADTAGMLSFIEDFTPPEVMSALQCAEPLGEVSRYRTPSSRGVATTRCDDSLPVYWFSGTQYAASTRSTARA